MDEGQPSLQAFALLVRAQQMLIARLTRSEQGGRAPDEAPADEAGPDTIPEQHLVKVLQVCASATSCQLPPSSCLGASVFMCSCASLLVSGRSCLLVPAITM